MHNYHKKNLVEYYRQMVLLCSVAIVLSTALTIYLINRSYGRVQEAVASTFVYSPTHGASVHVYSKDTDLWKTY